MADHVVVDLLNVVFETFCDPVYARERSVRRLITRHKITVTEATDAFVYKMLHTEYNNFSIMLVLDCRTIRRTHRKDEYVLLSNDQIKVDLYTTGDADEFIVNLFARKVTQEEDNELPDYGKGDNVFIVTNDRELGIRVERAAQRIPEHERPKVSIVSVPSPYSSNPVIPVIIDIRQVKNNGLSYLHPT